MQNTARNTRRRDVQSAAIWLSALVLPGGAAILADRIRMLAAQRELDRPHG